MKVGEIAGILSCPICHKMGDKAPLLAQREEGVEFASSVYCRKCLLDESVEDYLERIIAGRPGG